MKIIDDGTKKLHRWNRNYFFIATVLVVLVNIVLYWRLGDGWVNKSLPPSSSFTAWYSRLNFRNLVVCFLNCFSHFNWQHILLNMLCFFICGLYLERRMGTLPLLGLVFVTAVFSSAMTTANDGSLNWHGYSGVNYALYAYIIVDFLFIFRKRTRTKFNMIAGAVMVALIYFAACFNGGTSEVSFEWYPHDFMYNMGHYSSFLAGLILGVLVQLVRLISEKERKEL